MLPCQARWLSALAPSAITLVNTASCTRALQTSSVQEHVGGGTTSQDPAPPEDPVPPSSSGAGRLSLAPQLLQLLVCPLTKGPLRYDAGKEELISETVGVAYPIRDGVPWLDPHLARIMESSGDPR